MPIIHGEVLTRLEVYHGRRRGGFHVASVGFASRIAGVPGSGCMRQGSCRHD